MRRQLVDKIKRVTTVLESGRVHIMFAVQAIEAWILADERMLNKYLGMARSVKHENEPEQIDNPKQVIDNLFAQCGKRYTPASLLELLPQLEVSELLRCRHFKEFYHCVEKIASTAT